MRDDASSALTVSETALGGEWLDRVRPGCGLIVKTAVLQTAMQDADKSIGDLAQHGVVAGAAFPRCLL